MSSALLIHDGRVTVPPRIFRRGNHRTKRKKKHPTRIIIDNPAPPLPGSDGPINSGTRTWQTKSAINSNARVGGDTLVAVEHTWPLYRQTISYVCHLTNRTFVSVTFSNEKNDRVIMHWRPIEAM